MSGSTAVDAPCDCPVGAPRTPSGCRDRVQVAGFDVRINDAANFAVLFKDIFQRRIYHFTCSHDSPRILDCGANIGMSVLFFKGLYPKARIVAFEPDPGVAPLLRQNVARNALAGIEVVEAALADRDGTLTFHADGRYAGSIMAAGATDAPVPTTARPVRGVRLSSYLNAAVDFLKLNIEGAEWPVIREAGDALRNVACMTIEYHHLPGLPRTLHLLLERLDALGFDYLIHDFDERTNPHSHPPFRLTPATRYYLLIHARRRGTMPMPASAIPEPST